MELKPIILQASPKHYVMNAKPKDYSKFVRPGKPEPLEPAPDLADFFKKARSLDDEEKDFSSPKARHNRPAASLIDIIKD